jgi:hypothetical protein
MLIFLVHQTAGMLGVGILAAACTSSVVTAGARLGWHVTRTSEYWVSIGNPFCPIQILCGLCIGWSLGRYFPHRYMTWVWLVPLAIFCFCFVFTPVLIPEWTSIFERPHSMQSRISYYLGWACQPSVHCLDRLLITMPLYSAVAYSLGAKLAQRMVSRSSSVLASSSGSDTTV